MNKPSTSPKVLHLLLSMGETTGAYNELCLPLAKSRDITICTLLKPTVTPPREITLFAGDGSVMGFFRTLRTALAAKDYDVIHAHAPHVGFLFVVANLLMLWRFMSSTVYTVQNSYQNYKLRNRLLMLPAFAFFRRVVFCSEACLESYPALYKWLVGNRQRVIPNSVNIDRVDQAMASQPGYQPRGTFTVGSVGRLIEIKNPLVLVKAFRQGGDESSRLVFIGEGHLRDTLTAEIRASGLANRVKLTGLIPRDKVFEELSKVDLFVSASRGEGLPVAVIEAMACRRPVVLSDIAPHREIASGTDFIPLVDPDDVAGFAREVKRFKDMSAGERARIGENCRKLVQERFSLTANHKRNDEVYAEVLGRSRLDVAHGQSYAD